MAKICVKMDENVEKMYKNLKVDPSIVVQNLVNLASSVMRESFTSYEALIKIDEIDVAKVILESCDRMIDERIDRWKQSIEKQEKFKEIKSKRLAKISGMNEEEFLKHKVTEGFKKVRE